MWVGSSVGDVTAASISDLKAQMKCQRLRARVWFATVCGLMYLAGWNDETTGPLLPKYRKCMVSVVMTNKDLYAKITTGILSWWRKSKWSVKQVNTILWPLVTGALKWVRTRAKTASTGLGRTGILIPNCRAQNSPPSTRHPHSYHQHPSFTIENLDFKLVFDCWFRAHDLPFCPWQFSFSILPRQTCQIILEQGIHLSLHKFWYLIFLLALSSFPNCKIAHIQEYTLLCLVCNPAPDTFWIKCLIRYTTQ